MSGTVRVVLVDDHDLVREGLARLLAAVDVGIVVVGEAGGVEEALEEVAAREPDLVLLDLRLGEGSGLEVAQRLRAAGNCVAILVLSAHTSASSLRAALAAGADGFLLKSISGAELAEGIRRCVDGDTVIGEEFVPKLLDSLGRGVGVGQAELTPREREVLELVAAGSSNTGIAEQLGVSSRTVQKHVQNLLRKLEAGDRAELVSQAFRRELLG